MHTHIISIVNQKGGTGKTTTCVNLGAALAELGKRVLLIDFDPQGNLSFCFGLGILPKGMTEVMLGECSLPEILKTSEGIDIASCDITLADVELSLASYPGREDILTNVLKALPHVYDYVLIDCAPSLSLLTVNALKASNKVLIPLQLEVLSLQGLSLITDTIFKIKETINPQLKILGVLPVMVDVRRKVTFEVYDYMKTNFGLPIFKQMVHVDVKAVEAPSFGVSVLAYAPNSESAKEYRSVAKELLGIK